MKTLLAEVPVVSPRATAKSYRFDIFKGVKDAEGRIQKVKSIGAAQLFEGCHTYSVYLKTFTTQVFYLMAPNPERSQTNYVLMTREASKSPKQKFFWNNVGDAKVLSGANAGLMLLNWDLLGREDLYLNLYPMERPESNSVSTPAPKAKE